MAAPALAVDKEQVRMFYETVGAAETGRRTGIKAGTIRQWARRGGWNEGHAEKVELVQGFPTPAKTALAATLPESMRPVIVTNVTKPADAYSEMLAEKSKNTKMSLAIAAENMAKLAEDAPLERAGDALQVGKLAALAHGWEAAGGSSTTINVLIQ